MAIYFCKSCLNPLDRITNNHFQQHFKQARNGYKTIFINDMKHSIDGLRFFHYFDTITCPCGEQYIYIFQTRYNAEFELNLTPKDFRLLHIDGAVPNGLDGTHLGSKVRSHLELYFYRWGQLASHTFIITPFIGAYFKKTKDWDWLMKKVQPWRTTIVTRDTSAAQFKKLAYFKQEPMDLFLKTVGEDDHLQAFEDQIMKPSFLATSMIKHKKFHAKVYAGVFPGKVEVVSTSYNLFEGEDNQLENVCVSVYSNEYFLKKFIAPFKITKVRHVKDTFLEQAEKVGVAVDCVFGNERGCKVKYYTDTKLSVLEETIAELRKQVGL